MGRGGMQFPISNFCSNVFPHLKIPKDAGERKGGGRKGMLQNAFLGHLIRDDLINQVKVSVRPSVRTSVAVMKYSAIQRENVN